MEYITTNVCILMLLTIAKSEIFYFNEEIDGLFKQFREDIIQANNSQFPLPDIHAEYTKSLLFVNLHGQMNGTQGTVKDISTIRRTSNVTIVTARDYFVFRVEFGFDGLNIGYKYNARFMGVPLKGEFDLSVENNSIYVELLMNLTSDRCSGNVVTVRNLKITTLDKIKVRLTGFSVFNSVAGYLMTHSFGNVSKSIIRPIEDNLRDFFKANINQFDFCKFGSVPENIPFNEMDSSDDMAINFPDGINITDTNAIWI